MNSCLYRIRSGSSSYLSEFLKHGFQKFSVFTQTLEIHCNSITQFFHTVLNGGIQCSKSDCCVPKTAAPPPSSWSPFLNLMVIVFQLVENYFPLSLGFIIFEFNINAQFEILFFQFCIHVSPNFAHIMTFNILIHFRFIENSYISDFRNLDLFTHQALYMQKPTP